MAVTNQMRQRDVGTVSVFVADQRVSDKSTRIRGSASLLDLVNLTPLMQRSRGAPEVVVALIDGPVAMGHPDLTRENIHKVPGSGSGACIQAGSAACMHGTFVAGILCAKRESPAPAICPGCTLLVRPVFRETATWRGVIPSATPEELASAIVECAKAGARVINLSVALAQPSMNGQRGLQQALGYAASRGVIVVAAAGNQGTIGSSAITRHPGVIPVVACDSRGRPMDESNLAHSIARRGLMAPGGPITSLGATGEPLSLGGTSVAAPIVTGAIALLWSEFPGATASEVKFAVSQANVPRRTTIVPRLLDAWRAYEAMASLPSAKF